jgi:hypothetical protein
VVWDPEPKKMLRISGFPLHRKYSCSKLKGNKVVWGSRTQYRCCGSAGSVTLCTGITIIDERNKVVWDPEPIKMLGICRLAYPLHREYNLD